MPKGTTEQKVGQRRRARLRKQQIMWEAKQVPCWDCGGVYPPYVLDFDHVEGKKRFNIGSQIVGISLANLRAEIAKCQVVCANCHRKRTYSRKETKNG